MLALVINQADAAVYIGLMATLVVAMISGTFMYLSNRRPKSDAEIAFDSNMIEVGKTPAAQWNERFEKLERMHLWTLAVLVGQGSAFMAYCFFERADRKADGHRLSDRIDMIQMAISERERK